VPGSGRGDGLGDGERDGGGDELDRDGDGDDDLAAGEDGAAELDGADGVAVAVREDRRADRARTGPLAGEDGAVVTTGLIGGARCIAAAACPVLLSSR
jgi:hypothetical protein